MFYGAWVGNMMCTTTTTTWTGNDDHGKEDVKVFYLLGKQSL